MSTALKSSEVIFAAKGLANCFDTCGHTFREDFLSAVRMRVDDVMEHDVTKLRR